MGGNVGAGETCEPAADAVEDTVCIGASVAATADLKDDDNECFAASLLPLILTMSVNETFEKYTNAQPRAKMLKNKKFMVMESSTL
jgi:hypothetical protein